jgi:uncharacterized protein YggU (UPF0235/DUF167 family)
MGRLSLKVLPGSSRGIIAGCRGDSLSLNVKIPPGKGRGNGAVVALMADRLEIEASNIAVVSGHSSPATLVIVDGMDDEAIRAAFPHTKAGKTGDVGSDNKRVSSYRPGIAKARGKITPGTYNYHHGYR